MAWDTSLKPNNKTYQINSELASLVLAKTEEYAIITLDVNGYLTSWNKGAEKNTGYTADETIGKHLSIFYSEEARQQNIPRYDLNEALKNNKHETEGWRLRKDGSRFWTSTLLTALYDDDEKLIGFSIIARDITDKKKLEEHRNRMSHELEDRIRWKERSALSTERRFRKLIENSYDGISLLDKNLQVFYRSRSAERINGWNDLERSVKELSELVHPDDMGLLNDIFKQVIQTPDQPFLTTYRVKHRLGHYIYVECLLVNRLNDTDINSIVCNFRDVTERVKADEQISEKNQQIEHILESITDGFISLDKHFNYTYLNNKIGEMLGIDSGKLIGKNIWDVFPKAINSATYRIFHQALETKQYLWNEDYYEPLGLWYENHVYPNENGLAIFIRDITERKIAEASLVQSESNLRSVFENTDLSIIMFDTDAKVLSFNNNAAELSKKHFNKELKAGISAFHYASLSRRKQIKAILHQVLNNSPIVYEISYQLPDKTIWYEVRWVNVRNDEQEHMGIILTLKDITEKKETELQRERITQDLIQRNKDLEQFTYIVSHNLRAPVANIKGLSQLLSPCNNADDQEVIDALSTSVNKLDDVIHDMNEILQVDGSTDDTLENVSLNDLIAEITWASKRWIEKHNAVITTDFTEIRQLKSLKGYLYSIFQNLIINGIKFRRPDQDPMINIVAKQENGNACIYVRDNGRGIDLERQGQHLFGLYKRFDMNVEGKGMGLFMVKMQVERLGGKISVASKVNEGTEFKIEFPIKQS